MFEDFDFASFYAESESLNDAFAKEAPTAEMIAMVEKALDVKLPASYIEFLSHKNGGYLLKDACPCNEPTSWAEDHVGISSLLSIDKDASNSLLGELGSKFMIEEWGYPDIGVAIADCPSAGHDMIFLDYRKCGRHMERGEPEVVHIDQEFDYKITFLAKNFEEFVRMLVPLENYEDEE